MKKNFSRLLRPRRLLLELLLLILVIIQAVPLLWCVFLSLKTQYAIFNDALSLPIPPQWENYAKALSKMRIGLWVKNTLFIAVIAISGTLITTLLAAFAIGRMNFGRGRLQNTVYVYFLFGIIVPVYIIILPLYLLNVKMSLVDNPWGLILPYIGTAAPMNIMILVAAFRGIPTSLEEAAVIEGCGLWRLAWRIVIPLVLPSMATVIILQFLGIWNDYPFALVMINSKDRYTIALSISQFKGQFSTNYEQTCAALTILLFPQLAVFAYFQKYIMSGLAAGAVKG